MSERIEIRHAHSGRYQIWRRWPSSRKYLWTHNVYTLNRAMAVCVSIERIQVDTYIQIRPLGDTS